MDPDGPFFRASFLDAEPVFGGLQLFAFAKKYLTLFHRNGRRLPSLVRKPLGSSSGIFRWGKL
jgi:hypothetical protein